MTARVIPFERVRSPSAITRDRFALLADIKRWGQPAGHYAGADNDLNELVRLGLIRVEGERWALTDAGKRALAGHEGVPPPRGAA